ncbi:MAG: amidohydrolase family protein [Candidatus Rokubacteria bacterium]|nr:amidohydrolase family protein [Candidatus Rokubacteria bacterium]
MNLDAVPILDQHCHSLLRAGGPFTPADYARFFTESGDRTMHERHVPETVFFRWAIKELARRFDCDPTAEAVVLARERTSADALLRDANIAALLVDYGYQTDDTWPHAELAERLPCRVLPLLRLETLAQQLILRYDTFDAMLDAFVAGIEAARAAGYVGLKSIVAYRTGLAVRSTTRAEAAGTFAPIKKQARRDGRIRLAVKPLNDYLLLRALEIAEREALPVQFHTGFGDSDVDLLGANPLHLRPLLENDAYRHVAFVLLHASYPYVRELGYLAAIHPNVYADIGLAVPHLAADIPAVLRQLLGLTPASKIVYSSDASQIAELYWLAARWGRWGLGIVLDELVALGALNSDEALAAARQILGGNAARVYGVPWP